MDVSPALKHFGIDSQSTIHAVQQVRTFVEGGDRPKQAAELIDKVVGVHVDPSKFFDRPIGTADHWAIMVSQAVVEGCIKQNCIVEDAEVVVENAFTRAQNYIMNPLNKWMFVANETTAATTSGGEVKSVSNMVDTKVEVRADGKIKKGGKEVMAVALYQKYVADLNGAEYSNQAFIAILVKELGMTKAGATTYNYNMKKKFGGKIEAKVPMRVIK